MIFLWCSLGQGDSPGRRVRGFFHAGDGVKKGAWRAGAFGWG